MLDGLLPLASYVKIFVAILVIVNPLGIIPVFVAMSASHTDQQNKTNARIAAQTVAVVLLVSALLGERVLDVFGISMASFKVGGALLIMLNAVAMMQATPARDKQTPEEAEEASAKASIAVVPLGIPLLAGPGAMSTNVKVTGAARLYCAASVLTAGLVAIKLNLFITAFRIAEKAACNKVVFGIFATPRYWKSMV